MLAALDFKPTTTQLDMPFEAKVCPFLRNHAIAAHPSKEH